MKLFKYSFGMLVLMMVFLTSCTDFVEPRIPYKTFDTGAYLRTVARTSTSFNFFDLANSRFAITVEAVDAENGKTVESVEVRVRRRRLVPGVGLNYIPAAGAGGAVNDVLVTTLPASAFATTPDSKFLRAGIQVTAQQAFTALGITAAQVNGGDVFEFRLTLRDKFGRVFNDVNASPDIRGGLFYDSPFLYNIAVVCPSNLGRSFTFRTTNITTGPGGDAGACGAAATGSVTLTAVANLVGVYTISDASFGVFACAWGDTPPGGSVRFNDACGALSMSGTDKYGDTYSLTFVSNTGTELTFDWRNSYGDGGRTTLVAPTGFTFPNTLK